VSLRHLCQIAPLVLTLQSLERLVLACPKKHGLMLLAKCYNKEGLYNATIRLLSSHSYYSTMKLRLLGEAYMAQETIMKQFSCIQSLSTMIPPVHCCGIDWDAVTLLLEINKWESRCLRTWLNFVKRKRACAA
jgi:hypothetical protein